MLQIVTSVAVLMALVFASISFITATDNQATVAEQYQKSILNRFDVAAGRIFGSAGPDGLLVRTDGIYSLEEVAQETPSDQPKVIETLSIFVRAATTAQRTAPAGSESTFTCAAQRIPTDVQAALTVLGRRNTAHDQGTRIDLSHSCLRTADLEGLNLDRADLAYTDLTEARLSGARLNGADLTGANLAGATLERVLHDGTVVDGARTDARTRGAWWLPGS